MILQDVLVPDALNPDKNTYNVYSFEDCSYVTGIPVGRDEVDFDKPDSDFPGQPVVVMPSEDFKPATNELLGTVYEDRQRLIRHSLGFRLRPDRVSVDIASRRVKIPHYFEKLSPYLGSLLAYGADIDLKITTLNSSRGSQLVPLATHFDYIEPGHLRMVLSALEGYTTRFVNDHELVEQVLANEELMEKYDRLPYEELIHPDPGQLWNVPVGMPVCFGADTLHQRPSMPGDELRPTVKAR